MTRDARSPAGLISTFMVRGTSARTRAAEHVRHPQICRSLFGSPAGGRRATPAALLPFSAWEGIQFVRVAARPETCEARRAAVLRTHDGVRVMGPNGGRQWLGRTITQCASRTPMA